MNRREGCHARQHSRKRDFDPFDWPT